MSASTISIIVMVIEIAIALMVGVCAYNLLKIDLKQKAKNSYERLKDSHTEKIFANPEKRFAYDAMQKTLISQGIKYRMGDSFSPFDYMMFRIAICLGCGIFAMLVFGPLFILVGVAFGFVIVPYYFKHEDDYDNNEMLSDIGMMYGIVSLQAKSGIYISKIIYECYLSVEQPRLKKALLELSIDIENFASVKGAADRFRAKFNNSYIDTFAKTLEQAESTGSAVKVFEDIAKSVEGINEAIAIREEKKLEMRGFWFMTAVFSSVLIIVVYRLGGMMSDISGLL